MNKNTPPFHSLYTIIKEIKVLNGNQTIELPLQIGKTRVADGPSESSLPQLSTTNPENVHQRLGNDREEPTKPYNHRLLPLLILLLKANPHLGFIFQTVWTRRSNHERKMVMFPCGDAPSQGAITEESLPEKHH